METKEYEVLLLTTGMLRNHIDIANCVDTYPNFVNMTGCIHNINKVVLKLPNDIQLALLIEKINNSKKVLLDNMMSCIDDLDKVQVIFCSHSQFAPLQELWSQWRKRHASGTDEFQCRENLLTMNAPCCFICYSYTEQISTVTLDELIFCKHQNIRDGITDFKIVAIK